MVTVYFVETVPLGRGSFFMCWDLVNLTTDHLSISVFMYAETHLRSKKDKVQFFCKTTGLAKGTTDSPVQIQCMILSTFQRWLQFSLCFDVWVFFKQLYELLLKNLSSENNEN